MTTYYRALPRAAIDRPMSAVPLAGGALWFSDILAMTREGDVEVLAPADLPTDVLDRLTARRAPVAECDLRRPVLMGILNVTPDSFSDGGRFADTDDAVDQARAMVAAGAGIIDVGGESTRPGADTVDVDEEISRVVHPISVIHAGLDVAISIDTRKAAVAERALDAGAALVNDVSGFTFDANLAPLCAKRGVPVCVMHAQGDPQTMQNAPQYDDVRFDVYDFLEARIAFLEGLGLARSQIVVDPGIGFGKTLDHNLSLLRDISLFHSLGCAILLGASRKKFIGTISGADIADTRVAGSVSVALHAAAQGVQILRVHDVPETAQALALWRAVDFGEI
ncbi:dihydropteroate synthase [Marivita hallyeonensis]|uniref:Dihydropteroate synthase n=1 Tax=Marivita hallyeonensis TaxID=996342 RepID=A0A1M5W4A8_9RHOB|nr:dihydropteroate synthase [Marivita hallyeonensis]SHH82352.1 Dihydropteroate synthase [Marivita hallyeonensis]